MFRWQRLYQLPAGARDHRFPRFISMPPKTRHIN
jgi:hypothetical protein